MNVCELRKELSHRLSIDMNDYCRTNESWRKLTEILSENISETIRFFQQECTDEELFWLSEVFEEVVEETQSKELIQVLRDRLAQVTPERYDQQAFETEHMRKWIDYPEYVRSVGNEIEYAEGQIED